MKIETKEFKIQGGRPIQEDFVLNQSSDRIWVVCDGFGGGSAGIGAAQTVSNSVYRFLKKEAGDWEATLPFVLRSTFSLAGNVLFNSLIFANRNLLRENEKKSLNQRGGSSVVAAYLDGDLLALALVGTCSAWLKREGAWQRLVTPRSFGALVDPNNGAEEELYQIPLQALGVSSDVEPEIFEYRLRSGDEVFLVTDGLNPKAVLEGLDDPHSWALENFSGVVLKAS